MIAITSKMSSISTWKPAQWIRFIHAELVLNRVKYEPIEKYKDSCYIYQCLRSMEKNNLSREHFIGYVRDIIPHLQPGQVMTDMRFLLTPLKNYFNISYEKPTIPQNRAPVDTTISMGAMDWLDKLKGV